MDRESIKEVIRDVFGPNYLVKDTGGWVSVPCFLSQWTHDKGHDTNPSAGVLVADSGLSIYSCFTCGNKMPFFAALGKYARLADRLQLLDVVEDVEESEYLGPAEVPGSWEATKEENMRDLLMPINEEIYMGLYPSAAGHPYLRSRGISDVTARELELLYDPGDTSYDKQKRILFPVRGPDGLLYGFSGRAVSKKAKLKVKDYHGLVKSSLVLGSHLINADSRDYAVVTEGLMDYARGWECGQPTCALMHSGVTDAQADVLRELGKRVYAFTDDDSAGWKGEDELVKQLGGYLPVMGVTYPKIWIVDSMGKGHWLSDPAELEPGEFSEMIRMAEILDIDPVGGSAYNRRTTNGRR